VTAGGEGVLVDIVDAGFARPRRIEGGDEVFQLTVPRFSIARGQRIALVGASGSGKTTLLSLLALALKPAAVKRFAFQPKPDELVDVAAAWRRGRSPRLDALRRRHIGIARQSGEAIAFLTVRDALVVRERLAGVRPDRAKTDDLLSALGLDGLHLRTPDALSQGQRQRLGIGCALTHRPTLVIADEPTASLDAQTAQTVMTLLSQSANDNRAVVIATHDPDLAMRHGFSIIAAETRFETHDGAATKHTRFATSAVG